MVPMTGNSHPSPVSQGGAARARNLSSFIAAGNANLADGFEGLIRRVS
jgi:hypothetical protein